MRHCGSSSRSPGAGLVAALLLASACGQENASHVTEVAAPILPRAADKKCVLLLHGKGGGALPSSVSEDVEYLRPGGNDSGWGGREWRYFPEDRYGQFRASIAAHLDASGCGRTVVHGFSNGGAAAAKLYCRGENFDGRVIGYIIDDPVPDEGVMACKPRSGVRIRLYWTGGLTAEDGGSCATRDWTCEGGRTIGIERYAGKLGTRAAPSIHTAHAEYAAPPEVPGWLK